MEFLKKISQNDEIFTFGQKMQSLLSVKEILLQFLTELLNSKSLLKQNVAELTKVVKIIERQLKPRLALSSMPFSDVSDALTVAGQLEEKHSASSAASVLWMSVGSMLLNFSDRTRTGAFSMIWPLAEDIASGIAL